MGACGEQVRYQPTGLVGITTRGNYEDYFTLDAARREVRGEFWNTWLAK